MTHFVLVRTESKCIISEMVDSLIAAEMYANFVWADVSEVEVMLTSKDHLLQDMFRPREEGEKKGGSHDKF